MQRKCADCQNEDKKLHRSAEAGKEEDATVQMKQVDGVASAAGQYISALGGGGSALSAAAQQFFGSRMGHDFSNVKIHTDAAAAQSAKALQAKAYTVDNHVVFGQGAYNADTAEGKKLLAHELTHVIQQQGGAARQVRRKKIDYTTLSWSNFKGAVPKDSPYDAETASNIEYPKLIDIKTTYPTKEAADTCTETKGKKEVTKPKTEVEIKLDASKLKIRPYMDEGSSWAKPGFKSPAEMKKQCTTETADNVKACKDYFTNTKKANETACAEEAGRCEAAIGNDSSWTNYEIEATDKAGCKKIKQACLTDLNGQLKDETGGGKVSKDVKDCSNNYVSECMEGKQAASASLLQHEQGHFDITNIIAQKLQADIKALVDGFSGKKFVECKKEEAVKKAKEEVKNVLQPQIDKLVEDAKAKVAEAKANLRATQDRYDTETGHSANIADQSRWDGSLGKGAIPAAPAAP